MAVYFTSDMHLHHKNIIKYCSRPFATVEEMDEALIENWNNTVGPRDTVWHLGDFSFGSEDDMRAVLRRLNGRLFATRGNHDRTLDRIARDWFYEYLPYAEIKVNGQHIVLCHYAFRVWNRSHHGALHFYGHSHGNLEPYGKSVDVGVDSAWVTGKAGYRPFSIDELVEFMKNREVEKPDHHGQTTREGL